MPYSIEKRGEKLVVLNTETKQVKGTFPNNPEGKRRAARQLRLLRGIEGGEWKPTGAKAKS